MAKNPSAVARKWAQNTNAASQAIKEGVQNVQVNPMEKAAARADAYAQGVQRAIADGKYQRGLRRVSKEDWQKAMIDKGVPRIGAGATAAVPKMEQFMSEFLPHVEAGQRLLESMPRGDINANIQRAIAMMQHNAAFRRR